ncbi:hypothetical protein PgNI_05665 [Pyricularia grisea]|uniref:Uncharacterized protein n=1 Tax=Pyricularia grisea TaxID=148305 RepID=A0A6P8B840_PYRGI|nr:hypothetical protein PgNI_05665 [Pyricularia grisea]TLD11279.1 hypothetical protein PgNI_05665 [Pyricularia grisea]
MCLLYFGLAALLFRYPTCPVNLVPPTPSVTTAALPRLAPELEVAEGHRVDDSEMLLPLANSVTAAAGSVLVAASVAAAQNVVPFVNPAVPTGVPIPGNYTGVLRPRVHFTPPQHFMNDPNGMFRDANGIWHVYYQYNPTGLVAGNQHWGHATSQDLYHWNNQKIAIFPPEETIFAYSGSIVVDVNNTSKFFPPGKKDGVVAILTLAQYMEDGTAGPQTQALAYSMDGGFTFEYYNKNPVIAGTSSQFRDPKVFWYQPPPGSQFMQGYWVMAVAYSQEFAVGIYTSPDLRDWTPRSNFTNRGLLGAQYECPGIVKMPIKDGVGGPVIGEAYVLIVSVQPGAPLGGSVTQYFPGKFNGTHFFPFDDATRLTDFAKDNYAAQYFEGVPSNMNAVNMGWASNWAYAQSTPTGQLEGWRGGLTLPRSNYLTKAPRIGWIMVDEPYDLTPVLAVDPKDGDCELAEADSKSVDMTAWNSGAFLLDVLVTGLEFKKLNPDASLNFTLSAPGNSSESLKFGMFFAGDMPFFIDRAGARSLFQDNVFFTDKFSTADVWDTRPGSNWTLRAIIDRSIAEFFVDGGIHSATVLIFPTQPLTVLGVQSGGLNTGAKVTLSVRPLQDTWVQNGRSPSCDADSGDDDA